MLGDRPLERWTEQFCQPMQACGGDGVIAERVVATRRLVAMLGLSHRLRSVWLGPAIPMRGKRIERRPARPPPLFT